MAEGLVFLAFHLKNHTRVTKKKKEEEEEAGHQKTVTEKTIIVSGEEEKQDTDMVFCLSEDSLIAQAALELTM